MALPFSLWIVASQAEKPKPHFRRAHTSQLSADPKCVPIMFTKQLRGVKFQKPVAFFEREEQGTDEDN